MAKRQKANAGGVVHYVHWGVLSSDDEAVSGSNADRVAQVAQDYVKSQGMNAEYSHVESGDGGVA